jgi:glycosyltransferase involved in cell wall biosynthesis
VIEEKKGLDILLNALTMVTVPYRLTIAGDGNQQYVGQLKAIAANIKVDDKIDWVGFQAENKFDLLQDHDLFVLPSHDENFGNSVIESLSVGTPVLISDEVGLCDYVAENSFGWICQTNPVSVGEAINEIASNQKAERQRIRTDAPGIIYDDFNESNLVKRYIKMYGELL